MFKSKLQEFCQAKGWELPEYVTMKEGWDHCPRFKASVLVNGTTYFTPGLHKTSKEAQNLVAKLAFDQLTGPSSGSATSNVLGSPGNFQHTKGDETTQAVSLIRKDLPTGDDKKDPTIAPPTSLVLASSKSFLQPELPKNMARMCKHQLQIYTQKRNLALPVYISEREGPPHAPHFRCKVILNGTTYESQEYYGTIKDAENAAAKVALMSFCPDGIEEEDPALFKNLLQELAQKDYSCLPEYNTISSGPSHSPIFISNVDIKNESFRGLEAKTKKLAEIHAAKIAYSALKERKLKQNSESEVPRPQNENLLFCSSSKLQSVPVAELPHGTNTTLHLRSEASGEHAIQTNAMSAYQTGSESKDVVGQPECSSDPTIQKKHGLKVESLPFQLEPSYSSAPPTEPLSTSGFRENNEPWASLHASSPQKKVKVFPKPQNMALPPGVKIVHEDEKWVAVTMDVTGNAQSIQ